MIHPRSNAVWFATFSAVLLGLFGSLGDAWAADFWPRFRGPNGDGYVPDAELPLQWEESDYAWKVSLPGLGHGSPVIWNDQIYLMSADLEQQRRWVLAYDLKTGQERWRREFPLTGHEIHRLSSFASGTGACDEEGVYFSWADPEHAWLHAFDHDGRTRWEQDLGTFQAEHGFGQSPMIYEGLVILLHSQSAEELPAGAIPGRSRMLAFDRRDGKPIWSHDLRTTRTCYGVPCIVDGEGGPELIGTETGDGIFSLDPHTGSPLWSQPVFSMRCVSSPIVAGDLVIGTAGSGGGGTHLVAVRVRPPHDEVFRIERVAPYVPTPVRVGDRLLLCSDNGIASSVDAATGELQWSRRLGGKYYASPLVLGSRMLCLSDTGSVTTVRATDGEIEGQMELGEAVEATPAFVDGWLVLRTASRLLALKLPPASP
jgi:outer membrane protein assembly factor BamB